MKKLMILGAGVYQVPLIKKAKALGFYTIVVSPAGNYPGISCADEFIDLDTTDVEGVLSEARRLGIDGVVTTGTDVAVPTIGKIVEELNLCGTPFYPALVSMDKTLMKRCLVDHGIPTAKYFEFSTDNVVEALQAAEHIGFPVMVKASDSSGSRGVIKVDNRDFFPAAFHESSRHARNSKVLVEQFLDGHEVGAQAIVIGSSVDLVFVHNDTVTAPPTNTPIGHSLPSKLNHELIKKVEMVTEEAIKAIGIKDTIVNVDLMIVDGQPFIIELGARMGATCLPENISTFCGADIYELLINISMGNAVLQQKNEAQANASLLLSSDRTGVLNSIIIPEHIVNDKNVVQLNIDVQPGDRVRAFKVGPDRLGDIVVKGPSAEEAEAMARQFASEIIFKVDA